MTRTSPEPPREGPIRIALAVLCTAVRAPLFGRFDFVSFDGTYYLNQARALLHGSLSGGAFPVGYPLVVAPLMAVIRDGVVAGMLASFLASVGSTLVFYELSRLYVSRTSAVIAAAVLTVTPLFIQTSLLTMSESVYVFWVLLALWLFARRRMPGAALALGMAAATRPEALAIAGVLGVIAVFRRRSFSFPLIFLAVYTVNVAAMSIPSGELTLLSRGGAYRSVALPWTLRETSIEYRGKEAIEEEERLHATDFDRVRAYAQRLPASLADLGRQLLPVLPLLALVAIGRRGRPGGDAAQRPTFILAAFLPLAFIPLFTEDRGHVRWMVPYVPPLILFGMIGLEKFLVARARTAGQGLVVLCALFSPMVNRATLAGGLEPKFKGAREVGARLAARMSPGDEVADRKPFVAFYAGATYVEIPVAPYDETIAYLAKENVRFLSLHQLSTGPLRPALLPLLYDIAAVRGELRYRQIMFEETGEIVYERALDADPLVERRISPSGAADFAPAWSPDGRWLAFRRRTADGKGTIRLADANGDSVRTVIEAVPITDFLTWSPDGRRIAFSMPVDGNQDLYTVDVVTGRLTRVTRDPARDYAPSWCRATGDIVFGSDRGGTPGAWLERATGGDPVRLSGDRAAGFPTLSPSGAMAAWLDGAGRLNMLDRKTGQQVVVGEPLNILAPPAWSPDERVIAVGAYDWGSADIYLIRVSDGRALRLTRALTGEGMPSWSPDGARLAVTAGEKNKVSLAILEHIEPYLDRLDEAYTFRVFERPKETRSNPPAS